MFLAFVRDSIDPAWHRIDTDVATVQRVALCGYRAQVANTDESPWSEVWKRKIVEPSGVRCGRCENIALRLTRDILDMPISRGVPPTSKSGDVLLTLGDDFKKLLDDL